LNQYPPSCLADPARYVTVDYDRQQFTLGPTIFPSDASSTNLVTVYSPDYQKPGSKGLSGGAIAGIAVGAVAAGAILAGIAFWIWRRKHKDQQKSKRSTISTWTMRTASMDNTTIVGDVDIMSERGDRPEFYKPPASPPPPGEEDGFIKPELDATQTVVRPKDQQTHRHELSAGSIHRPSNHGRNMSDGSVASGVSPMGEVRITSMLGEPSPPIHGSGASSPPMIDRPGGHSRHHSDQSPSGLFELGDGRRQPHSPD
jgi:hypothetical protein